MMMNVIYIMKCQQNLKKKTF